MNDVGYYDAIAKSYDEMYQDRLSVAEDRVVSKLLMEEIGYSQPVYDVGCGTGHLLELLPIWANGYLGLDTSDGMLQEARRKFPLYSFVQGDMESNPPAHAFSRGFNAAVSLYGSFNHARHPLIALGQLRKVLLPGARLFYMAFTDQRKQQDTFLGHAHPLHVTYWTAGRLRGLFAYHHFRVQVQGFYAYAHRLNLPPMMLSRWIEAEHRTIGRLFPDLCSYLIVKGYNSCV